MKRSRWRIPAHCATFLSSRVKTGRIRDARLQGSPFDLRPKVLEVIGDNAERHESACVLSQAGLNVGLRTIAVDIMEGPARKDVLDSRRGDCRPEFVEEVRRSRLLINRLDVWLYSEISPYLGRRVLEIGSGHGNLVQHLLDRDLVVAMDVDSSSVELIRREFARDAQVHALVRDVCDPVDEELRDFHLDTVVSLNVLEHVEDDQLALSRMADLLEPGGRIVVIVPAHEWLYGTMDRSIGHYRRYNGKNLRAKVAAAGFVIERQCYLNVLGIMGWLINGRILKKDVPPVQQLKWFNHIVPPLQWLEQRFRPPIGLSLLTIARKLPPPTCAEHP